MTRVVNLPNVGDQMPHRKQLDGSGFVPYDVGENLGVHRSLLNVLFRMTTVRP